MTLLFPLALAMSAVAAAVVALYLLKIRRHRQRVPSLDLWMELVQTTKATSIFQRLRRLLSMLLWLAIVALLILALGNPLLTAGRVSPRSIVLIIDNSASMQSVEDDAGRTRLDLARGAVDRLVSGRPVNDQWTVIDARAEPRVLRGWTRSKRDVLEAVGSIEPFPGRSDPHDAADLALQLAEGKPDPTIVYLSDGDSGAVERALRAVATNNDTESADNDTPQPSGDDIADDRDRILAVYWPVGSVVDNIGITHLRSRLHRQQATHHVFVRVEAHTNEPSACDLVFLLDGSTHHVEPIDFADGPVWERSVPIEAPLGGVLEVRLSIDDALAHDNTAFTVLDPIRPASVLLVSDPESSFFFEQALRAMDPLVSLETSRVVTPEQYGNLPHEARQPDLVIFNRYAPGATPERGSYLFVGSVPTDLGVRPAGVLDAPLIDVRAPDHPLMRYLVLSAASVARTPRLELPPDFATLAATPAGEPMIFAHRSPGRRVLCVAFDVLESDLPVRNAFPILLRNTILHQLDDADSPVPPAHRIGQTIAVRDLPVEADLVSVTALLDGTTREQSVPMSKRGFRFTPEPEPHVLRFDLGDEVAYTSVNLTSAAETATDPSEPDADPRELLPMSTSLFGFAPWITLSLLALGLTLFEWVSYHRRWTE